MRVIIFKLDNPSNKYEWQIKDVAVKTVDDLEKLMGCCATYLYAEVYHIDNDDEPALVEHTKNCVSAMTTCSARSTITRLFTIVLEALKFIKETGQ